MSMFAIMDALREVGDVIQHGDDKYGVNAWRSATTTSDDRVVLNHPVRPRMPAERGHAVGALGHLDRYLCGETIDAYSGKHALAHVIARCLIALQLVIDREQYAKGTAAAEKDS